MSVTRSAALSFLKKYRGEIGPECLEMPSPNCLIRPKVCLTWSRMGSNRKSEVEVTRNAATSLLERARWRARGGPRMAMAQKRRSAAIRLRFAQTGTFDAVLELLTS